MELMRELNDGGAHFDGFLYQGRTLFTDKVYTGIPIVEKLMERKTRLCGTLNSKRRGLPEGIKEKVDQSRKLVDSGKKNRKNEPVLKPQCVLDYNAAKKGTDYSDQMAAYYTTLRKTQKWYKKVAVELLTENVNIMDITVETPQNVEQVELVEEMPGPLAKKRKKNERAWKKTVAKVARLTSANMENVTTVKLFSDGCGGQNKNTTVVGMIAHWLLKDAPKHVTKVVLLFPVVGHSFIPPDRVFGVLERKISRSECNQQSQ
ncbi:uncharacterized protein LOC124363504 [Homalodisca vitripennis]|uniref:uncharacterized protein LOC124363504 n=1 Tax=Homalodisca vitripennis TaxID=197043 RepID=UPI001EEC52F1|nr:uncharacterized protein LOC124363504 [Homalodisca vitripennis]